MSFDSYDLPISLPVIDQFRRRGGTRSDELYLHELFRLGYGGAAPDIHQKLEAQAALNARLVELVMMLMLPLLAVALAVPPKRSASSLGIFLAIVIIVAYHKVNQYAELAGAHGRIDPVLALWMPLLLLSVMIWWMYHVLAHRPGGQPIGALEFAAARTVRVDPLASAQSDRGVINLNLVPSRQIALYTVRLFLTRSLAVLIALILILMSLDLLGESGKILAVPGNTDADLWRYVGLSAADAGLALPALLGSAWNADRLRRPQPAQRGRVDEGRGDFGPPDPAPLVFASVGIAAALFAFNELVVVKSARVVTAWQDNDYKPIPPASGTLSNVWLLNGEDLIHAGFVGGKGATFHADNVAIYDRGGGVLQRVIRADHAYPQGRAGGSTMSASTTPG